MTYTLKMARTTAPAIDRMARRLSEGGYSNVLDGLAFSYRDRQMLARFGNEDDYKVGAPILAEELRKDGFGWRTTYDNNNANTGRMIGLLVTHPAFLTRTGDEVPERPASYSLAGPMPGRNVYLDADTIETMAQEAAEVMRDMLRAQAVKEFGTLPEGTFDLPPVVGNPLETSFDRDVAEHNDEPVYATKPRLTNVAIEEVVPTKSDPVPTPAPWPKEEAEDVDD